MNISVLEAPICVGSPTKGSENAYDELVSSGLKSILGKDARLVPLSIQSYDKERASNQNGLNGLDQVMEIGRKIYKNVNAELKNGRFPIVIGGDHSCAMGSIAGASAHVEAEKLSVVYIDGHADINTDQSSLTGYIHGMPLAAAMGICSDKLTIGKKINLYGKNTFIIGARSIDPAEYGIIEDQGVTLYGIKEIKERGISAVITEVLTKITTPYIHVSFDVDFVDGNEFSSTGYVMPDGASFEDARLAVKAVLESGKVCSMDIVEYNPTVDTNGLDRSKLFNMFEDIRDEIKNHY